MPFIYAIEELHPYTAIGNWQSSQPPVFTPVTKEVAETSENGVFALTRNSGEQITGWMDINGNQARLIEEEMRKVKSLPVTHQDALCEELAIGDYVTVSPNPAEVSIGRVLGFTKRQVRILVYGRSYGVTTKNPSGLVKIQPNIISD